MIINILKQIFFVFLILYLGVNFLRLFRLKFSGIEILSSGLILGIGFSTFGMFLLSFLGFKLNYLYVFLFLTLSNLFLIILNKVFFKNSINLEWHSLHKKIKSLDLFDRILIGGIAFFLLTSLIRTLYWPVWMWDAVQLYDYRAKLMVLSQSIFFPSQSFYDISYPLLTSILHAIFYIAGSLNPQFIYSLIFSSLVLCVYAFSRKILNRKLSLSLAFLVSFYPLFYEQSLYALTDLIQSTYLVIATFYLINWMSKKKFSYLILSGLLFAFSRFTRNEPVWIFVFLFLFIYSLIKRKFLKEVFLFFIFNFFVGFVSTKYIASYNLVNNNAYLSQLDFIGKTFSSLNNFSLKTLIDPVVLVCRTIILEMIIPIVSLVTFGFLTRFRLKRETFFLIFFCCFYLLMFFGGTLYYRIISSHTDFLALVGNLDRFSIFWRVLVFTTAFSVFYDFWVKFQHR